MSDELVSSNEDPVRDALELAYRCLNRRERTVSEIREQLRKRVSDGAAIEEAIGVLLEEGYLDDGRYARLFAEDKRTLEQWGSERIERTLRERGIDRELIADALSATSDADGCESDLERALSVLRRRFPRPPRDRRERDRALGILIRKGYESELAVDALAVYARDADEAGFR